jgi:hypothetical protein
MVDKGEFLCLRRIFIYSTNSNPPPLPSLYSLDHVYEIPMILAVKCIRGYQIVIPLGYFEYLIGGPSPSIALSM